MIKADAAGTRRLSLITTQNGAQTYVGGSSYLTTDGSYSALVPVYSTITSATTTSIDAAPAANTISDYDAVNIKNTYAGDHAMTLQITSGSGGPFVLKVFTLGQDESMNYAHGTGFQFFDSEGNLKVTEVQATPPTTYPGGIRLTGVSYPRVSGSNLSTGNNDLYTVPAGKRALISTMFVYNHSGVGNIVWYPAIKISGTYYRLLTSATTGDTATGSTNVISYIAEAGETLSIVTATNNGANVYCRVAEFDSSCAVYSPKLLALANGDNLIYTVPSGKTAVILDNQLVPLMGNGGTALMYVNSSGGARNIQWFIVPSGQSTGVNFATTAVAAASDTQRTNTLGIATLSAGDFLTINTNAATATQIAWVNVMETPT